MSNLLMEGLSDQDFLRYSRQIMLPDIGEKGQVTLRNSTVLIVGCGGLGSSVGMYLSASGIGTLIIADGDKVELSNLQRQVVYRDNNLNQNKAMAMAQQLKGLNGTTHIEVISHKLTEPELSRFINQVDVVLDCSDNLPTRHEINAACVKHNVPLISGAAIGWQGQLMLFSNHVTENNTSCYHCLFPFAESHQTQNCQSFGIVGPVVGMIGNLQALETIKYLTQPSYMKWDSIHQFDGRSLSWTSIKIPKDNQCSICSSTVSNDVSRETYSTGEACHE
ncbi:MULTISPECIES: HesA/MoeB/ThiF family protein [Aliivibrio]|uniref:HesA/MoeB/ThiF family protein n=1 Tax=Aliivibrio finisterrensis TaxID=511998 RepID=A0A4Q5KUI9_9GAMM|nr:MULTISPECIES: HesA/MoeB/ThiF family protein [Aliivibrio]MDD9179558.1 HesA/MoeB/ThiF family protein [Aliivibrio sp. A6]RYU50660.1 HesA/MoeB/ThiF family protein [Aliivibrio finisterrensis]RYU51445.1 HesA/MoeB/ThiF family protein [Aliivibrio finisterrensis]RYU54516.1 HesA/MoeB/ThiF family protein [Aliivibrio finisterrensis]RYU63701.1 HesA/MoeB/ThiF family protein [Aliivibrio finisterrensis]